MKAKAYTDLEQSKKLAEILPIESADMSYATWTILEDGEYIVSPLQGNTIEKLQEEYGEQIIPCWSLAALLDQLDDIVVDEDGCDYKLEIIKEGVQYYLVYEGMLDAACYETSLFDDLIDACVEMIVTLKEKDLL